MPYYLGDLTGALCGCEECPIHIVLMENLIPDDCNIRPMKIKQIINFICYLNNILDISSLKQI